MLPKFEELLKLEKGPRIHPNGFIQLDLDKEHRLHVWPDEDLIPKNPAHIHDHTFGFESTVIKGSIANFDYNLLRGDAYHIYHVIPYAINQREEPMTKLSNYTYDAKSVNHSMYNEGETWYMPPFMFHDVMWFGLAATIIKIGEVTEHTTAKVLCPIDETPEEKFDRHNTLSTDELWAWIEKIYE